MPIKKVGIVVIILLMGAVIWMWGSSKNTFRKKYSVENGTVLKIYNKIGVVNVSSWDFDYIEVEASQNCLPGSQTEPSIDTSISKEFSLNTMANMDLTLKVPKGVRIGQVENSKGKVNLENVSGNVEVQNSTGEINITGLEGLVKATVNMGKLSLQNITGNVEAKVGTGDLIIKGVQGGVKAELNMGKIDLENITGEVDAQNNTGDVKIREVNGFVTAKTNTGKVNVAKVSGVNEAITDKGDISVEIAAIRDNLNIKSRFGKITALLAPGISAQLEASAPKGSITYKDLPLTVSQSSQTKVSGKLHDGSGKITLETAWGSITLKPLL